MYPGMNTVQRDIVTYGKQCKKCDMHYRYQEHKHIVHNFDDHMLLSTELCLSVRSQLKQHAISSLISSLEEKLGEKINHQRVVNALLVGVHTIQDSLCIGLLFKADRHSVHTATTQCDTRCIIFVERNHSTLKVV